MRRFQARKSHHPSHHGSQEEMRQVPSTIGEPNNRTINAMFLMQVQPSDFQRRCLQVRLLPFTIGLQSGGRVAMPSSPFPHNSAQLAKCEKALKHASWDWRAHEPVQSPEKPSSVSPQKPGGDATSSIYRHTDSPCIQKDFVLSGSLWGRCSTYITATIMKYQSKARVPMTISCLWATGFSLTC